MIDFGELSELIWINPNGAIVADSRAKDLPDLLYQFIEDNLRPIDDGGEEIDWASVEKEWCEHERRRQKRLAKN